MSAQEMWKSNSKRQYRKMVAELTEHLELPEVMLAAQRADEIKLQRVASKATKNYTRAFLNETAQGRLRSNDAKRLKLRDMFLDTIVEKGLKGGQVMPHEFVSTIRKNKHISRGMELAMDAQWKNMTKEVLDQIQAKAEEDGVDFDPTRMVPICDVSGSMEGVPMDVSIALGIMISEITHPAFQNMVLTFSESPTWHRLQSSDTIVQKVRSLERAPWGMSTDFAKAYDLVLESCLKHKLKREDVPCLIVFSDMQFDQAYGFSPYWGSSGIRALDPVTMFQTIRAKMKVVADKLGWQDAEPTPIVFWNLRNTGGHPVDKDTEGTVLLAGFSPSLLKLVMNGEALKEDEVEVVQADGGMVREKVRVTPEEVLRKMLDDPLYDPVRRILDKSEEGVLKAYKLPINDEGVEAGFEMVIE